MPIGDDAREEAAASSAAHREALAAADALRRQADWIAALPHTLAEELRERDGELPVEVIHGSDEQWSAWARYARRIPPRAPINLYPDLEIVRTLIVPSLPEAVAPMRGRVRFRAIIGAAAVITEDDHAVVGELARAGVEVRLAPVVASWVYVDPGVLAAIPLVWGEHPPSSIMVVHDRALSTTLGALLEPMWASARPWSTPTAEWSDTLHLLALGLSDSAVAAAQSTSERTVQRRVSEAMAHYGVGSRFALAAAWSADGATRPE
jgi:hypothetical protein